MSIQSEIELLQNTKNELRTAIMEKGVTVYADDLYSTYPTRISQISMTPGDKDNLFRDIIERDITSITIPDGTTTIRKYCFYHCENLESVFFPESLLTISENAFRYCVSLTSVTIPSSVTRIWDWSFDHCSGLTSITINATTPPTLVGDNKNAFDNTNNCPIYVTEDSVQTYKTAWPKYASRIQAIPVESFAMKFTPAGGGTPIEVELEDLATAGTIARTDVPSTITTGTGTLEIGEGVTSIGDEAFWNCSSLTSVNIPDSVTTIEGIAFYSCTGLNYITVSSTTPPTLGLGAFDDTNDCPLIVPVSSVDAYKTAWSEYADRITCEGVAYWKLLGGTCNTNESGYNTGYITNTYEDVNPSSSTYGQQRTEVVQDEETCPISAATEFRRITDINDVTSGKYLIVDTQDNVALNASLIKDTTSNTNGINGTGYDNCIDVAIENDTITADANIMNAAADYDANNHTLSWTDTENEQSYFIQWKSGSTYAYGDDRFHQLNNTIPKTVNGNITFSASDSRNRSIGKHPSNVLIKFYAETNSSYYTSIALFKLV